MHEQQTLWEDALSDLDDNLASSLNGSIAKLVSYFNLSPTHISNAALKARSMHQQETEHSFEHSLWNACRSQSRPRLDELAQSVETAATWEDLILPAKEKF
ncbi:MAG: ATP-binding protein, partial [Pseudanabaena sp.]